MAKIYEERNHEEADMPQTEDIKELRESFDVKIHKV